MLQIKNFLIKREQSQARLSFAKREKSRLLAKTILTLVALLAVTTGAWADETKVTIDASDYDEISTATSFSKEKDGITIAFSSSKILSSSFYFESDNTVTITSTVGKIKSAVFYCMAMGTSKYGPGCLGSPTAGQYSYNDMIGTWTGEAETFTLTSSNKVRIEKIDVTVGEADAPASGPEVAWDKTTKTGTFTMPGGNVTLEPEYYPQAALTAAPTAIDNVPATTDGAIVEAGTVANIGETTTAQGTVMYYVSQTELDDAALLALAADQWTADVPTAADLAQGQAYIYYYVRGNDSDTDEENFSDGDILSANALTVTIAAEPTYAVTFAEGVNPEPPAEPDWTASPAADVKKGETVTVTYTGTKKVIGVKAEKKAKATGPITVTLTTGEIGDLVSWGSTSKTINGITIEVSGDAKFRTTGLMDVSAMDPETGELIPTTGTYTFTSSVGNIKRIDINHTIGSWGGSGDGWPGSYNVSGDNNTFTWSGTPAASVTLNGSENCMLLLVSSIVFTIEPTN